MDVSPAIRPQLFDIDRKQFFDVNDLDRVMRSLGESLTKQQLNDMVRFPSSSVRTREFSLSAEASARAAGVAA